MPLTRAQAAGPRPSPLAAPDAGRAHTCSPAAPALRILKATTRFGLRGRAGGGHNESGSRRAGPIGRRAGGRVVGRETARKPAGGGGEDGVARTAADSARSRPALAPPGQSGVPDAPATASPTPAILPPVSPSPGANRRLFPFNGPGPAPALPPAPLPTGGRSVSHCPRPSPTGHPLHPGRGQRPGSPASICASGTEGRSWDPGRSRFPGMRVPAPTPRRGRHGRGYCPCPGMTLSRGPRRPAAASSAGP